MTDIVLVFSTAMARKNISVLAIDSIMIPRKEKLVLAAYM
jgi:hypothetical protein